MNRIFLSYRREDSADVSGRINDRLAQHFGQDAIFTDVDSIPYGVDFQQYIDEQVGKCDIFLAVIGRDWLSVTDADGRLRLQQPSDFVRIEVESALQRDIPVIPLLVRRATMPSADDLPAALKNLAKRNGTKIRPNPDFHRDMERLINGIEQHLQVRVEAAAKRKAKAEAQRLEHERRDREAPVTTDHAQLAERTVGKTAKAWKTSLLSTDSVDQKQKSQGWLRGPTQKVVTWSSGSLATLLMLFSAVRTYDWTSSSPRVLEDLAWQVPLAVCLYIVSIVSYDTGPRSMALRWHALLVLPWLFAMVMAARRRDDLAAWLMVCSIVIWLGFTVRLHIHQPRKQRIVLVAMAVIVVVSIVMAAVFGC